MSKRAEARKAFDDLFAKPDTPKIQHDPLRPALIITQEALDVPESKRTIKGTVPPPPASKREAAGYSRRDVVNILDRIDAYRKLKQDVPLLPARDVKIYRALADGNEAVEKLAADCRMSVGAFKVFVADLEKTILDECAFLRKRCGFKIDDLVLVPDEAECEDAAERKGDEHRGLDEKAIGESGGAAIGGRIVSRGTDSKGNPLQLDTFERSGKMHEEAQEKADYSDKGMPEYDDYSEESGA